MSAVFVYLDRVYSGETTGIASIRELAIASFRKGVWENEIISGKTTDDILTWVAKERADARYVNSTAPKHLRANVNICSPDIKQRPTVIAIVSLIKLLDGDGPSTIWYLIAGNTKEYYATQAVANHPSSNEESGSGMKATEYVSWALDKVKEEEERAMTCVDEHLAEIVVSSIRTELGSNMRDKVVRRGELFLLEPLMKLDSGKKLS